MKIAYGIYCCIQKNNVLFNKLSKSHRGVTQEDGHSSILLSHALFYNQFWYNVMYIFYAKLCGKSH